MIVNICLGRLNRAKKGLDVTVRCRSPLKHLSLSYCSLRGHVSQWDLPSSNRVFGSTKLSWMEKGLLIIVSLEVMDGMYLSTCSIYSFGCVDAEAQRKLEYRECSTSMCCALSSHHLSCICIDQIAIIWWDFNRVVGSICVIEKLELSRREVARVDIV